MSIENLEEQECRELIQAVNKELRRIKTKIRLNTTPQNIVGLSLEQAKSILKRELKNSNGQKLF